MAHDPPLTTLTLLRLEYPMVRFPEMHRYDPTRRRIIDRQRAEGRRASWHISPDDLRQLLVSATAEVGTPALYADRFGCTPGFMWEVLTGERRASGPMLDVLGLVWDKRRRAYADPLLSRKAKHIEDDRLRRSLPPGQRDTFEDDPDVKAARERAAARAKVEAQPDMFPSGLPELPASVVEDHWVDELYSRDPRSEAENREPWPHRRLAVDLLVAMITPSPGRARDDDVEEMFGRPSCT